jgi:hypothetical protein
MSSTPVAAIKYLEAARPFANDHGLGVAISQLDLTNWAARGVGVVRCMFHLMRLSCWTARWTQFIGETFVRFEGT